MQTKLYFALFYILDFLLLTCVGLAFNFGKLILVGFNCNVDGLHGVGGNRLPCPLRATNTG